MENGMQGCGSGGCASGGEPFAVPDVAAEKEALSRRMETIKHKILVLSGKGGVGKSTVAVNLAMSLALAGKNVGLLDIDIHGPSIPKLLGIEGARVIGSEEGLLPVTTNHHLKVISIGFMLRGDDEPVIWRGPMKYGVIKQFLAEVEWGDLDYLIIDSPPGTGDEPLSIAQLIEDPTGAIIVTTPQDIALTDVRKSITFCRSVNLPVLGVVENMSGFVCPSCGETTEIFKAGGGKQMALDLGVPFLGKIPIDPNVVTASDSGKIYVEAFAHSETAKAFLRVIKPILELAPPEKKSASSDLAPVTENSPVVKGANTGDLRIAIPVAQGKLSLHFGHCEQFALIDTDTATKEIKHTELVEAPEHQPGLLPRWLAERGANVIIAGGMGMRAKTLFAEHGIDVVTGAPESSVPEEIAEAYIKGTLKTGENICDH